MKTYDPSEPVIGLHIPKTGGTSLFNILQEWFPNGQLFEHYATADSLPLKHTLTGGSCAYGHFNSLRGFGVGNYYPQVRQFFCFVREPFERILSLWFYANHNQARGLRPPMLDDHPSFETWLRRMADREAEQTNELGMFTHVSWLGSGVIGGLLESQFIFVGTMERFTESVNCLADILGKPRTDICHFNKTIRTETDLEKWRPFYHKHFSRDMEFYSAACRINAEMLETFNHGTTVAAGEAYCMEAGEQIRV